MSESEYRSDQTAARARVAALEDELRDLEAVAKSPPAPDRASSEEKNKLRDSLKTIERRHRFVSVVIALLVVLGVRVALFHPHSNGQGSPAAAFLAVACALLFAWWLRAPSRKERALEQKLRTIVKREDDAERRFRVEAKPARRRVVEQELAEAREMANEKVDAKKT